MNKYEEYGMPKLSVAMITYNEETRIRGALESVKWADDIVVVDARSTDRTVEIARTYTDRVIVRDWLGFVAQKNFALDQTRHEWVLSIDADERLSPALQKEVRRLCNAEIVADAYYVPRRAYFLGRWITHSGWYPDYKIRLFRKTHGRWQGGTVHESVQVSGTVRYLQEDLLHYPYRDLSHNLHTINRYSTFGAEKLSMAGKRAHWYDMTLRPALTFLKKYLLRQGFRDGYQGLFIAILTSYANFAKYAKLWERQRTPHSTAIPREVPDEHQDRIAEANMSGVVNRPATGEKM
jgi:glycosyltransferase involved in cell wall biosynthesis